MGQSFRRQFWAGLRQENRGLLLPFALGDDPPLDPVVGTTFELGGQLVRGPAIFNASVYRTNVRDDISFIQSETAVFEGFFDNMAQLAGKGSSSRSR